MEGGKIDDLIGFRLSDQLGETERIARVSASGLQGHVADTPCLKLFQQFFADRTFGPED
jgi:hypothetical protein